MKRALVVEQEKIISMDIRLTLERAGFDVTVINDDLQRLLSYSEALPDLIIIDAKTLKALDFNYSNGEQFNFLSHIPLVLTYSSTNNENSCSLSASFNLIGSLVKPYDPSRILEMFGENCVM